MDLPASARLQLENHVMLFSINVSLISAWTAVTRYPGATIMETFFKVNIYINIEGLGLYISKGPLCDDTCKCLDATTGEVSVSAEGIKLETSSNLPNEVFNSDNRLDCSLFSADSENSAALENHLSDEMLAKIFA